jgi:hypothetical protein
VRFYDFVFEYEKVVLGGSLNAVAYAFANNLPIIYNLKTKPNYFEFLDKDLDLSALGLENSTTDLQTATGVKTVGMQQRDLWTYLVWALSLSGKTLMTDKVSNVRIESENALRVTTDNSRFARVKYDELLVFDSELLTNIPNKILKQTEKVYKVYDWMNITNGMNQQLDYFCFDDDFVKEIYLYPTDRVDGDQFNLKDILVVSYLNEEQLQDFDYSDTYAKFKTLKLLKQAGIKGNQNGWRTSKKIKRVYYSFKLETTKREVMQINQNLYEDTECIKFIDMDHCESLGGYTGKEIYINKLFSGLFSGK